MVHGYAIGNSFPSFVFHLKDCGKLCGKMHQIPSVSSSSGRPTRSTNFLAPYTLQRNGETGYRDDGAAEMRGHAGHLDGSPACAFAHDVAVEGVENAFVGELKRIVEQNEGFGFCDFHGVALRKRTIGG